MTGINNVGQQGLSYIDQLKSLQEANKPEKTTGGKNELKQEDFLALLTKQLSQQDPSKPVENDQMIAQMASFATVDGIGKMNKQFDSLNTSMTSNQALQASSLVGRDVLVPGAKGLKEADKGMAAMVKLPKAINSLLVRVENEQGQLIRTLNVGAKPAGDSRVEWDGKDDKGNPTIEYNRIMDKKPGGKQRRIRNYFDIYARKYLGERQNNSDRVFQSLPQDASSKFNLRLREWVLRAGIPKHITFHCAKDSFAMYHIIHKEVGVFQLSGLLNHTDIRSSMHYYDLCAPELKKKLIG